MIPLNLKKKDVTLPSIMGDNDHERVYDLKDLRKVTLAPLADPQDANRIYSFDYLKNSVNASISIRTKC